MKHAYKNILALSVISAIIAILLAVTNYITAPIIKENEAAAENEALLVVMPDGGCYCDNLFNRKVSFFEKRKCKKSTVVSMIASVDGVADIVNKARNFCKLAFSSGVAESSENSARIRACFYTMSHTVLGESYCTENAVCRLDKRQNFAVVPQIFIACQKKHFLFEKYCISVC